MFNRKPINIESGSLPKRRLLSSQRKVGLWRNPVRVVNSYTYLGLFFSTRHSFAAAMEDTAIRAKKSTIDILSALKKIGCNSPDVFFKLVDTPVLPTLLYAAEIWGYQKYDQLERVHLFACKLFLHVLNKTPNDVVYGELGRYPLWITATTRCLKYWFKLLRQPEKLYARKAYSMLLKMHEGGAVTWVTLVKSIKFVTMVSSKYGYLVVEIIFIFREKKDCTAHVVMDGVITWSQVTSFHCTANTRIILKEKHTLIFYG